MELGALAIEVLFLSIGLTFPKLMLLSKRENKKLEDKKKLGTYLSYQQRCVCFDLVCSFLQLVEVTSGWLSQPPDVRKEGLPFCGALHELQLYRFNSMVL